MYTTASSDILVQNNNKNIFCQQKLLDDLPRPNPLPYFGTIFENPIPKPTVKKKNI